MISRIASDRRILHGKPRIRGTRIAVVNVLELLASGVAPRAIRQWYPDLSPDDVRACLDFANRILNGEESRLTRTLRRPSRN